MHIKKTTVRIGDGGKTCSSLDSCIQLEILLWHWQVYCTALQRQEWFQTH